MTRLTVMTTALGIAFALGAVRGAAADEVVVLDGSSSTGLLMRSDGPRAPGSVFGKVVTGLE